VPSAVRSVIGVCATPTSASGVRLYRYSSRFHSNAGSHHAVAGCAMANSVSSSWICTSSSAGCFGSS
jgi:hypothetical protein